MTRRLSLALGAAILFVLLSAFFTVAYADHSWGGYHWARTANPFTVKLGDNVSFAWDSYLVTSKNDWSKDPAVLYPGAGIGKVLSATIVAGAAGRNCKATTGMVQVCNNRYGNNGWLGIASIWLSSGGHISAGTVKLNDTYYNTSTYNTPAWRNLVMCQEIGHTFGLDHQDENFSNANLGTCMDYTSNPASNQHPNQHDYEQLALIYGHFDAITTISQVSASSALAEDSDDPKKWGKEIRRSADGHSSVFEQDLGNGKKVLRHVFWAEPRGNDKHHHE